MTSAGAMADGVNGCRGGWRQQMMWRWRGRWRHLGLTSVEEHWHVKAVAVRGGAWRKLEARNCDAETSGGAWGRVGGPMKTKFHKNGHRLLYFCFCLFLFTQLLVYLVSWIILSLHSQFYSTDWNRWIYKIDWKRWILSTSWYLELIEPKT